MLDTFMKQAMHNNAHAKIGCISPDFDQEKFKNEAITFIKRSNDPEGYGCWHLELTSEEPTVYDLGPATVYCDHYYAIVNFGESHVLYRRSEERKDLIIFEDGKNIYAGFESGNNTFIASQVSEHFMALDKHAFGKFIAREGIQIEQPSKPAIKSANPKRKKHKPHHRLAYNK